MRPLAGLVLIGLLLSLGSCSWTMSQQRRQRISDCLAQCNTGQPPERGALQSGDGIRDQRSPCEQRCHSLR